MKRSLVLGFFDGIHKAHRAVIESAFKYSKNVVVITFKDSPSLFFNNEVEYIFSRENSVNKIKGLGVKEVVLQNFSQIASVSAENYLENLIKKYNPISISTGFNHTFGFNKTGNPEFLAQNSKKYNYVYDCISPITVEGAVISSTLIKNYLKQGNIEKANSLLESSFILEGKVIEGAKIGRTLGFPTANINYPENIVKIPYGVYSANVLLNNKESLRGILNWGIKPSITNKVEPVVEVHILKFNGDLYGQNIKIEIQKHIRGEQKFQSLEELRLQIKEDIRNA